MEDRQITPDFKEDRVFSSNEVNNIATELLEDTKDILYAAILEFDSGISDYDKEALTREVLSNLKKRI